MRYILVSDTHSLHDQVEIPDGDVLLHSGDFCNRGTEAEMYAFNVWMGKLPHKYKIAIAGNHDKICEKFIPGNKYGSVIGRDKIAELTSNFTYLCDSGVWVGDKFIYGSPWQPEYYDWAFNLPRNGWQLKQKWRAIPDYTSILLTHGPVEGLLDLTKRGDHCGCALLKERITTLPNLKLHVAGHIHEAYGATEESSITYVNASICTLEYKPTNKPFVIDLD